MLQTQSKGIEMTKKAIAYYRVSTKKQGDHGHGLDAQQAAVQKYAGDNGLEIISPPGEYMEVETGTNKRRRPKLAAAIQAARENDAVLLIAKLDRLARNVHFISGIMESGVKFVAVDMPSVDNFTIHILAAVAEQEAKLISKRTREGLAAAKAKGVKLGNPETLTEDVREMGREAQRRAAVKDYRLVSGYVSTMRDDLRMSLREIAERLNEEGHRTRRGKEFKATTVKRILDRGNGNGNGA